MPLLKRYSCLPQQECMECFAQYALFAGLWSILLKYNATDLWDRLLQDRVCFC